VIGLFLPAAAIVALVASRSGRKPLAWALFAWIASSAVGTLVAALAVRFVEDSESTAVVLGALGPLAGVLAIVGLGFLAARRPRESLVLGVRMDVEVSPDIATAGPSGPYRAAEPGSVRATLVLTEQAFSIERPDQPADRIAYRSLVAVEALAESIALRWTQSDGALGGARLRPLAGDARALARRVDRLRPH